MRSGRLRAVVGLLVLGTQLLFAQFPAEFSSPGASEQFRLGVQAYQRGRFSDAILLFEKSLAYEPSKALVAWWLGRAYAKTGQEDTALRIWAPLIQDPEAPPFLRSEMEAIRASRSILVAGERSSSYIEAARFQGVLGKASYFMRPSSLLPRPDGSVVVVAQGSNEVIRLDPNGVILERDRGGLRGFDRPFGIAELPDGTTYVTEFNGDRIARSHAGKTTLFGQKGRGEGQYLGPQHVTADQEGYLFIVDFGNARVVKVDSEGQYVLDFGKKIDGFPGFVSPTGIAAKDGIVYVADSYRKAIFSFDPYGNYLGSLADGLLHFPESLAFWKYGTALLIADTDRIVTLDLSTESVSVLFEAYDKNSKLVAACTDYNGNLLACDFDNSAILVLSEAPQMAAGYDIQIERIYSSDFPKVELDVSVKDRFGNPVVGLKQANFRLAERIRQTTTIDERGKAVEHTTETIAPIDGFALSGSSGPGTVPRVTFLLERSLAMNAARTEARDTLAELMSALASVGVKDYSMVGAGAVPAIIAPAGSTVADITKAALVADNVQLGRFDSALRLAVGSLLPSSPKDLVVYVGTGRIDEKSFGGTTLSELSAYMRNNDIHLFAVLLGDGQPDNALRHLVETSGGSMYYAKRARGLADLAAAAIAGPSGRYRFSFVSKADAGFGEAYLTVAAEAYLYKKSGRDELGYFAPLK